MSAEQQQLHYAELLGPRFAIQSYTISEAINGFEGDIRERKADPLLARAASLGFTRFYIGDQAPDSSSPASTTVREVTYCLNPQNNTVYPTIRVEHIEVFDGDRGESNLKTEEVQIPEGTLYRLDDRLTEEGETQTVLVLYQPISSE